MDVPLFLECFQVYMHRGGEERPSPTHMSRTVGAMPVSSMVCAMKSRTAFCFFVIFFAFFALSLIHIFDGEYRTAIRFSVEPRS